MSGFIDEYPPEIINTLGFTSVPVWDTTITAVKSGSERRTQNWAYPLHRFVAKGKVDCLEKIVALRDMWYAVEGPTYSFPFKDPFDHASTPVQRLGASPTPARTDQVIGLGDGTETEFQLVKKYSFGSREVERKIRRPVVSSVLIGLNGDPPASASGGPYTVTSVSRSTGIVEILPAPDPGLVITAGFLFDLECRFEDDQSLDSVVTEFTIAGFADLAFKEIPPC